MFAVNYCAEFSKTDFDITQVIMQCAKKFTGLLLRNQWKNVCVDLMKNPTCTQSQVSSTRKIHTSCVTNEFHEYDKRSGYDTGFEIAPTRIERIRLGLKQLKKEIQLWKQEWKEVIESDPILDYRAGIAIVNKNNISI